MTDKMGMKKIVEMIVVDADGEIITAAHGLVSSDNSELVKLVKRAAKFGLPVQLVAPFGRTVVASLDPADTVGITAALFSARPGRTKLLEAPVAVWDWLDEEEENSEGRSFGAARSVEEYRSLRATVSDPDAAQEEEQMRTLVSFFGASHKETEG